MIPAFRQGTFLFFYGNPDRPVEGATWFKALEYCNRRSMQGGHAPCFGYGTYGTDPEDWPSGWNSSDANHLTVSCNWSAEGKRSYRLRGCRWGAEGKRPYRLRWCRWGAEGKRPYRLRGCRWGAEGKRSYRLRWCRWGAEGKRPYRLRGCRWGAEGKRSYGRSVA